VKIEDYIKSLPSDIISGDDVQLTEHSLTKIFEFLNLNENDVFYHLGCGDGKGIKIALQKFHVKKAVGVDNNVEKIQQAKKLVEENDLKNGKFLCEDVVTTKIDDATAILFWFTDIEIIEKMKKRFQSLQDGCKIVTIWGPLPECLPAQVDFPYIINQVPFKHASLKEQLRAIFGIKCIDFVAAWEYAERYTKAIASHNTENDRFLTILQSLEYGLMQKTLVLHVKTIFQFQLKTIWKF